MAKRDRSFLALVGIFVLDTIAAFLETFSGGYVLARLWAWFVVAKLGAPSIDWTTAVGLITTTRVFTAGVIIRQSAKVGEVRIMLVEVARKVAPLKAETDDTWDSLVASLFMAVLVYPLLLLAGYCMRRLGG